VFLAANIVKENGKVIETDMTDETIEKARGNAKKHGYKNMEFRQGDIEKKIPVDNNSVDIVISNCTINPAFNKVNIFRDFQNPKAKGIGKMVTSDLVTSSGA
jgi:arsenite methyltransferase